MTVTDLHGSRRSRQIETSDIRELLRLTRGSDIVSLAGGFPDPALLPAAEIQQAAVVATSHVGPLEYGPTEGDERLRTWIAERNTRRTGVLTDPDQVIVTAGSQQALDLVARVLADAGDTVAIDDPGYIGALQAFAAADLALAPIPVVGTGLDVEHLAERLAAGLAPQFLYTVPNFHNPTGTTLGAADRLALAGLADRYGFVIVEDDPYDELCFEGDAPHPLGSYTDRVVSLGSFSKTISPGLRVGWLIAPTPLAPVLGKAKQALDLHTSSLSQAIVTELVTTPGWFEAHVERATRTYHRRAVALHTALTDRLGDTVECAPVDGGMFLWLSLPEGANVDTRALLVDALADKVAFVPGSSFAIERDLRSTMRLSFATVDETDLVHAADRLARAITQALWSPDTTVEAAATVEVEVLPPPAEPY